MIEKIMKAVKSNNKKRGRNITIGAVVGMLLLCTTVMGADTVGMNVSKNSSDEIEFSKDGNIFEPESSADPYIGNDWDKDTSTYTNNTTITGSDATSTNYGIGIEINGVTEELNFKLINDGTITGINGRSGYGIKIESSSIESITNNGIIDSNSSTETSSMSFGYGIGIGYSAAIKSIMNEGLINVSSSTMSYGITTNSVASIKNIINNGEIRVIGKNDNTNASGSGIYIPISLTNLENKGLINAVGSGKSGGNNDSYGINISGNGSIIDNLHNSGVVVGIASHNGSGIYNSYGTIKALNNKGVIYGEINGIKNDSGTINNKHNYGLIVGGTGDAISGTTFSGENSGLIFKANGGTYQTESQYSPSFGATTTKDGYIIKNTAADLNNMNDINGFESILPSDLLENEAYILNGIVDTFKISGESNQLNDSIINGFETAVVMDEDMSVFTFNNTVINGNILGTDDISAVNITGEGNTFNVQGESVINAGDTAISVTGKNNVIVLDGDVTINGKMKSTGNNTLNLNGKTDGSMNLLHDISGFTNMNVDNNVTLFEDITVDGTKTVTVKETGILNLRLKKSDVLTYSTIPTAVHAFSDRTGTHEMTIKGISRDEAGTLNFITNGIGREIYVDMRNIKLENMNIKPSSIIDSAEIHEDYIHLGAGSDLSRIINPRVNRYNSLNGVYKSIYSSTDENIDALRDILRMTYLGDNYDYNNGSDEEQLKSLMTYLNAIYTGTPYSYSSELSRRSAGMFRDIIVDNIFKPELNKWMIMGGLTHADGGTKDTYYGQNYHGIDSGSSDTKADMKLTGAYMLGKYGYSENISLGVAVGGNKSEAKMDMSKVKGNSGYLGAFVENYRGNLTLKTGAGIQYSEYDADRAFGGHSYSDKYSDMTYDIYLNGRYSHNIGENLFLEPYGTLSYTYTKQDGADEGNKTLAIETDSKSFDYTVGKVGVDLKKVIPHEKGKSTLLAGVSYTRILDGADEEYITGRFKGGSDFDILVAHKNQHSIGLNAKYALELENGVIFDVKGTYSVERDSHNNSGKNRTKGEWIVGAGLGYKF